MNTERDEAGEGPDAGEEVDAPDLTGALGLQEEEEFVWGEVEGAQTASPLPEPADVTGAVQDDASEPGSSSIATPSRQILRPRLTQDGQDSVSAPDDTPSLQRTPTPSVADRPRLNSPRGSLRPFDRRFQAKRTSSASSSILAQAQRGPGYLTPHSRTSSLSTAAFLHDREAEAPDAPWEVVRWTRLRKLTNEVFSEAAKRKFGRVTCMAVASVVALGTSRGMVLIFDTSQQLKCVIGEATKAVESGSVTAIAISADYTTVAAGHANGNIFTWEIARPAKPFLSISSLSLGEIQTTGRDGHVAGVSVLHLGFLGIRHTALVSADDKGMAFSHLATRGMGALARTVKTTRILGRYPDFDTQHVRPRKPSSVLAFSPLPMGTAEYCTDGVGLVAMLTPYLLVIVSTTPVAQTQHKVFRPKDIAPHSAMSGALAWYPAMQGDSADLSNSKTGMTLPKLAYCWSNVIQVLEVSEIVHDDEPRDAPPDLVFSVQANWRGEEPLVALQWLSKNIIAGLTISQQLIILDGASLQPTDSCDIIKKQIYHTDLFSSHLSHMIEKLDDNTGNMHGVVADAFYMSFRSYTGRLFILGYNDVTVGALSNWADRLLATMERGDYIGAIKLARSYYAGDADVAVVGLPTETSRRYEIVGEKLLELMSASLKYAFGQNPDATDQRASDSQLEDLVQNCFDACESLDNTDFLFEEVYDWFAKEQYRGMFFDALQTRVLGGTITIIPPDVLKDLVNDFAQRDLHVPLEELLCRLNPMTMDLDQVTKLCKGHELFDALFYVWSQGIHDYTTILGDLLDAIDRDRISEDSEAGSKIFTYLSYTLTGRTYPSGQPMELIQSTKAKAEMYAFLCLGSRASADGSRTKLHRLRQLLNLDIAAFMSMLNEAFEDSFLIGSEDREEEELLEPLTDEQRFGLTLNRQYVLDILIDFVATSDFEAQEIVFLDMFIARTVAKYPNDILLKDQVKHKVLVELCEHVTEDTAEDCQLSIEYLLSTYHPPDLSSLLELFHQARFYRVIKSIYRSEGQYDKLLSTCVEDSSNPDGIYECINDSLRPGSPLSGQQRKDLIKSLTENLKSIAIANVSKTAATLDRNVPRLHAAALNALQDDDHAQYVYLREIMEQPSGHSTLQKKRHEDFEVFNEKYIRLLCDFDPHHVRTYIETLNHGDLKLDSVLPALEASGMVDSAVVLMARDGQVSRGINRLVEHLHTLSSALQSLLERADDAPDSANIAETADDLVSSITKYVQVGIWLCSRYSKIQVNGTPGQPSVSTTKEHKKPVMGRGASMHAEVTPGESVWLELVDHAVQIVRSCSEALSNHTSSEQTLSLNTEKLLSELRDVVHSTFTALLRATTAEAPAPRFLPILRAFLERASKSSPSLAHLREVLAAIFAAYAFEEGILGLASQLLDKDLFVGVDMVNERRRRGWRPLGMACGACGKKVWGPGAGRDIWEQWYRSHQADAERRDGGVQMKTDLDNGKGKAKVTNSKGKGKTAEEAAQTKKPDEQSSVQEAVGDASETVPDDVVVFACRHLYHRRCLRDLLGPANEQGAEQAFRCPLET